MNRARSAAWLSALLVGLVIGLAYLSRLFETDAAGVSLFVGKPPTLDFTNLWYGGRLVLEGRIDTLFDVEAYREGLRELFAPDVQDSEWSYPPTILLIGAPLALLPLYPAYLIWTLGTLALLTWVMYRAGLPVAVCALLWVSPAALTNVFFGQNGAFTAAMLIGGLLASKERPILAGFCFGMLSMKPHLGLLVPVCLVAAGFWRTFAWSALFTALLAIVTLVAFGATAWIGFITVTQPMMQGLLEAPYGFGYQWNAATVFLMARWAGLGVEGAYAAQGAAAIMAAAAAWRIWRREGNIVLRVAATACLTLLATPYGYSYDTVMLAVAVLMMLHCAKWRFDAALIPAWLMPGLVALAGSYSLPLAPVVLFMAAAIAVYLALSANVVGGGQPVIKTFGCTSSDRQATPPLASSGEIGQVCHPPRPANGD